MKNPNLPRPSRKSQRGATLMIAMIFLVILTLVVVSSIKATNVNTRIVGNMQIQKEAQAAAQEGIETVISTDFTKLPTATSVSVDINDGGQAASTYVVSVAAPECTSVKPIKLSELDASNADDVPCYASGAAQNTGIEGAGPNGNSMCSNSNWDVNATATAPGVATTTTTTHQGIALRVALDAAC
ncbi:pilus assembly PilX N-terminal domain-containing protein [Variovorax robiniae]|uniref:Pilus assembly PilX N-terminal domain-containing protein n=1 Tax=Variovorax robiniae TaxID=1836199 RepID=A0ABU8XHY0_9BURK